MAHKKRKNEGLSPLKRMLRGIELPEFAIGSEESVEIRGGNTVEIEGARGIHTYARDVVRIRLKHRLLAIYGSDFDLVQFGKGRIKVTGCLQRIEWEEQS